MKATVSYVTNYVFVFTSGFKKTYREGIMAVNGVYTTLPEYLAALSRGVGTHHGIPEISSEDANRLMQRWTEEQTGFMQFMRRLRRSGDMVLPAALSLAALLAAAASLFLLILALTGQLAGPQGEPGVAGVQGAQGIQGNPGPQGIPGSQGVQGIPGAEGPQGPAGPRGAAGMTVLVPTTVPAEPPAPSAPILRSNGGAPSSPPDAGIKAPIWGEVAINGIVYECGPKRGGGLICQKTGDATDSYVFPGGGLPGIFPVVTETGAEYDCDGDRERLNCGPAGKG